jgi:hypothetical protein
VVVNVPNQTQTATLSAARPSNCGQPDEAGGTMPVFKEAVQCSCWRVQAIG